MSVINPRGPNPTWVRYRQGLRRFCANPLGVIGAVILLFMVSVALFAPFIAEFPKGYGDFMMIQQPPSLEHPFGTDEMGLDIFAQVVWGTRVTMAVGFGATLLSIAIGVPIGLLAGFYRGRTDGLLTGLIDIFLSLPILPLMIMMGAVLGSDIRNIALVIGVFSWPMIARVVRSQALSVVEQLYTEAARALGAKNWYILVRYMLPNVLPVVMVNMVLTMATAVLSEAGLSFLGLGDPTRWSWGRILENAHTSGAFVSAWWHTFFPSIAILLLVMSANFFGTAMNEILNPRLRRR